MSIGSFLPHGYRFHDRGFAGLALYGIDTKKVPMHAAVVVARQFIRDRPNSKLGAQLPFELVASRRG